MIRYLLPLGLFLGLVVIFFYGLQNDPRHVPSPLIDKPAPAFNLPTLHQPETNISIEDLKGKVTLINVWASWCVPCRTEHAFLEELKALSGAPIYGLNYKDDPEAAQRFLATLGNPFERVGADTSGRVAIDWGVYGVPETFVVDGEGKIVLKHVGPINSAIIAEKILPAIESARAGG